jgi:RNA polymerase sigma-70 factor (ECF subfamily)
MSLTLPTDEVIVTADDRTNSESLDCELRTLLRELSRGRIEVLDQIFTLCGDDLYALVAWRSGSAVDAEDAVQNVFLRLAQIPSGLLRVRRPRSYLLGMAHNAVVDLIRGRREPPATERTIELATVEPSTERQIDGASATRLLFDLPAVQREVVFLRDFAGLTFREIASTCRIPLFTAVSRHRLAIHRLRHLMGITS